jgi:Fe-S-cluster-containing hydrogenase component 2
LWRALGPAPARDDGPKVATKCDLCAGYADQACVRACPTGAAFRFDPVATFGAERMRRVGKDE